MRFGSWLYRLPPSNGAMCAPTSQASPCSIRAYASERFAFPARSDLISVPVRTMPASNVSSMVKSWRALRLRATVCSSRIGRLLAGPWWSFGGPRPRGHRTEDSHERRPDAGRRPSAYPPTGCPTRRASPARWCSYFDLSLHITSFRSLKPYPMSVTCARARSRASRRSRRSPIRDSGRGGPEDLERLGEVRVGARRMRIGQGHHHIRREADRVDPALRRGQPASDGQLEGATLPAELLPLLDGALPEGLLTDERRALRVLERSGDDLARRRAAVIDQDDDLDLRVGGDPIAERFGRDLGALRILLPEEHPGTDELARDLPRCRDVAAGVAAEVEDDLCPTGGQMRLQGVHHGVGRGVREARQSQIPDGAACEHPRFDLLLLHDVTGDGELDRPAVALEGELDDGPLLAADAAEGAVDIETVHGGTVDRHDDIARLDSGSRGGGPWDRPGHDELATRADRGAPVRPVTGARGDLRADPFELAADALQALPIVLGGQVGRVRIPERIDHPPDGALDHGDLVDGAARVPVADRMVGVPERLERLRVRGGRPWFACCVTPERVAGDEQAGAGKDGDDRDRDRQE